jgi:CHASE2 domain-containing sensor protein
MTPRRIIGYGSVAALAAAAVAALSPSALSFADLRTQDAMVRLAAERPPSSRVTIAAIDDRSLAEIGQWPWSRDVVARLIDGIRDLGARVVAMDMLLAEPDRFDRTGEPGSSPTDAALVAAAGRGGVVMSYALTFEADGNTGSGCVLHPLDLAVREGRDGRSPLAQLFRASGVVCSLPPLGRAAGASGYLNASPDRDGLLRRVPLLMEFGGAIYPSLALATVAQAEGVKRFTLAGVTVDRARLLLDDAPVLLDARATLLIRFRGGRGTYPQVPASDILQGRLSPGALRDRIVFVGATALGVQDVVSTPFENAVPGIEVHAAAAETLLQRDFLSTPPHGRAYELVGAMVFALAAAVAVAGGGFLYGTLGSLGLLVLLWIATFAAVKSNGVFLSPVHPTVGLVFALLVLTVAKVRDERGRAESERDRRERAHRFAVQSLTSLMEVRDGATGQHARRTQEYARLLAARLATSPRFRRELTPERVQLIAQLSPLHDIGKVGVSDAVLNKPGALSNAELDEMRRHVAFGHETIANAERLAGGEGSEALLQLAKDIVYTHHEWWDGRGYPRRLRGEEIPVAGRIMAVVDVYDALSHSRSYRASLTHDEAVAEIAAGRGTHFDPDVVDAFLSVADEFRELSRALRGHAAHS